MKNMRPMLMWLVLGMLAVSSEAVATGPSIPLELGRYLTCGTLTSAHVSGMTELFPANTVRPLQTDEGRREIHIVDGWRLNYVNDALEPIATMKVELLGGTYIQEKTILISNFEYLLHSDELAERALNLPTANGFDIRGFNHKNLLGDTLGVYLLFDDKTHVEVTLYFANNRFKSIAAYETSRDSFLADYTRCVNEKHFVMWN
jgi:hypothetical protein